MRIPLMIYALLAAGFCLAAYLLWQHWTVSRQIDGWPVVSARILSATISTHQHRGAQSKSVQCTYQYDFNGRHYVGTGLTPTGVQDSGQADLWFHWLDSLKVTGQQVNCFVNPAKPDHAYLKKSDAPKSIMKLVGGFTGCGVALLVLLYFDRPWKRFRFEIS